MKCNNIWITGIPEGEEKEQGIETLFEKIMTENFLNLERDKACLLYTSDAADEHRDV